MDDKSVEVHLPGALAALAGGRPRLGLRLPADADVHALLDALGAQHPPLRWRIRDETGALRRRVAVFVDADDVRATDRGLATWLAPGAVVTVRPTAC